MELLSVIHKTLDARQKPYPDSKVHEANMGPTWVLSAPDGPHVGPMNLASRIKLDFQSDLGGTLGKNFVITGWRWTCLSVIDTIQHVNERVPYNRWLIETKSITVRCSNPWRRHQITTFPRYCPFVREYFGHRWIPRIKDSDAEFWCFLWSAPWINGWVSTREAGDLRRHGAHWTSL